jgi:hypothetical protein
MISGTWGSNRRGGNEQAHGDFSDKTVGVGESIRPVRPFFRAIREVAVQMAGGADARIVDIPDARFAKLSFDAAPDVHLVVTRADGWADQRQAIAGSVPNRCVMVDQRISFTMFASVPFFPEWMRAMAGVCRSTMNTAAQSAQRITSGRSFVAVVTSASTIGTRSPVVSKTAATPLPCVCSAEANRLDGNPSVGQGTGFKIIRLGVLAGAQGERVGDKGNPAQRGEGFQFHGLLRRCPDL